VKPSINAAAIANDELENLITHPFNIESVKQLDAAALGSDRPRRMRRPKPTPVDMDSERPGRG